MLRLSLQSRVVKAGDVGASCSRVVMELLCSGAESDDDRDCSWREDIRLGTAEASRHCISCIATTVIMVKRSCIL